MTLVPSEGPGTGVGVSGTENGDEDPGERPMPDEPRPGEPMPDLPMLPIPDDPMLPMPELDPMLEADEPNGNGPNRLDCVGVVSAPIEGAEPRLPVDGNVDIGTVGETTEVDPTGSDVPG